ncbi:MAG: hypothetical protein U5R49_20530 [Deltaproteobacteria bacterium]|nr:hypothetical protein [Deltaproteobacteria bacterium]
MIWQREKRFRCMAVTLLGILSLFFCTFAALANEIALVERTASKNARGSALHWPIFIIVCRIRKKVF